MFYNGSLMSHSIGKMDYLRNKSEISNVCNTVEGHCLQEMKIMHHHASGHFDLLISVHQSNNPSRQTISILSGIYKRFTSVHPVLWVSTAPIIQVRRRSLPSGNEIEKKTILYSL